MGLETVEGRGQCGRMLLPLCRHKPGDRELGSSDLVQKGVA